MDSSITINIVGPGGTPVVPNTGLFTNGIGLPEAAIISTCAIFILSIIAAIIYRKKHHKGYPRLTAAFHSLLDFIRSRKQAVATLSIIAIVTFVGTFAILLSTKDTDKGTNALGADNLTVTVDNVNATIEVADKPVFAVVPVTATVAEATEAGYTLSSYAERPNLTAPGVDQQISIVTLPEGAAPTSSAHTTTLSDNTWGLSNTNPSSQDESTFYPLSEDSLSPTMITDKDYQATEANNTTTIYYAFYITPDMPKGTYNGALVNYAATRNRTDLANVVFDGNGLYFNGDEDQTKNTMRYDTTISDYTEEYPRTPNIAIDGSKEGNIAYGTLVNDVVTIPGASSLKIQLTYGGGISPYSDYDYGYLSFWQGAHPDYRANINYQTGIQSCGSSTTTDGKYNTLNSPEEEDNLETVECSISGDSVTFDYWTDGGGPGGLTWYGYYAVVTGYDADGNIVNLPGNKPIAGEYELPGSAKAYKFLGWSEDAQATEPTYLTPRDITLNLALTPDTTTTLYAVWRPVFQINYNGNGADPATNMDQVEQYTANLDGTSQVDLFASNFTKDGYGFVGWSTDTDAWDRLVDDDDTNNSIIYGPSQTITVDEYLKAKAGENRKLLLYAVWAPVETDSQGNPIYLQNWQGCSSLDPTTYNSATNTLSVGKHTVTVLTDSRDNNTYTIARLADGNCWMTENLRLNNTAEITTTNTHSPATEEGTTTVAIKNNDGSITNHLSPTNNNWCVYNWDTSHEEACTNQSYLNTNNTASTTPSPVHSYDFTEAPPSWSTKVGGIDANIYSYGNYYNWYSATAGNGKYYNPAPVHPIAAIGGDICPAGWNLPYGATESSEEGGNTSGGFYYLNQRMLGGSSLASSNNWRSFPNNFIYSGFWSRKYSYSRGEIGYYWSATFGNTFGNSIRNVFSLGMYHSDVIPGTSNAEKVLGYSVRCVLVTE